MRYLWTKKPVLKQLKTGNGHTDSVARDAGITKRTGSNPGVFLYMNVFDAVSRRR
jgi:hypothetical protein